MRNTLLVITALSTIIAGCTGKRVDLVESKAITLVQRSPENLAMSTSIFNDDGNLVILGSVSRGPLSKQLIPGHVDILITDSNGEELSSIQAHFRKLPSRRHGANPVAFRAELPGTPPLGSQIVIKYDIVDHSLEAGRAPDLRLQDLK
jgi:hypothetical protein